MRTRTGDLRTPTERAHVLIVVVGLIVPVLWLYWARLTTVSDGTFVLPTPGQSTVTIQRVFGTSELRTGDVVLAVNGHPLSQDLGHVPVTRTIGQTLQYTVRRNGELHQVTVVLTSYPFTSAVDDYGILLLLIVVLFMVVAGVFLIRPRDPAAIAMLVAGVSLPCVATTYPIGLQVVELAGGYDTWTFVGGDIGACVLWGAILHFTFVFPEPAAPLVRRPWLALGFYATPFLLYLIATSWQVPAAHNAVSHRYALIVISATAAKVVPFVAGVRLLVVFRTTRDADVRRRLRWIMVAVVVGFAVYLGLGQLPYLLGHQPIFDFQWLLLALIPVPLTIAAAILRYRLFDIEVVLTRTLIVGALSAVVATGYAIIVLVAPALLGRVSVLAALVAGGVIAIGALSLRRALSDRMTSLVYGHRDDPYEVVSRLSTLDTAAEAEQLLPEVVRMLARALRLPYVRLVLSSPSGEVEAAAQHGEPTDIVLPLPIGASAEGLGSLELGVASGREPFGPADRRLLDDMSHQLAEIARTVLLTRALQRSRERLVLGREEERRRIRRDLHDGVGPTLAAVGMQLEVAESMVARNDQSASDLLAKLTRATQTLIVDVRRIVDDLRPAELDEFGLLGAIRQYVRAFDGVHEGFWVDVQADDLGELPAAVEVATFRVTVEAVTNAAKHSRGQRCTVRIVRRPSELLVIVQDDGVGLPAVTDRQRVGLGSMRERAAELGGVCTITDRVDGPGTKVWMSLPLRWRGESATEEAS